MTVPGTVEGEKQQRKPSDAVVLRWLRDAAILVVVCLAVLLGLMAARASGPAIPVHFKVVRHAPQPPPYGSAPAPRHVHVRFKLGLRSGLLFNVRTGQVLWSRNPHARLPIASLTKMMTALIVVSHTR